MGAPYIYDVSRLRVNVGIVYVMTSNWEVRQCGWYSD